MTHTQISRTGRPNDADRLNRGGAGTLAVALGGWVLDSAGTAAITLGRRIRDGIRHWRRRRRAIGELAKLDDRMLTDIGVHRADIPLIVEGLLKTPPVRPSAGADRRPADAPRRMPAITARGLRIDPCGAAARMPAGCG